MKLIKLVLLTIMFLGVFACKNNKEEAATTPKKETKEDLIKRVFTFSEKTATQRHYRRRRITIKTLSRLDKRFFSGIVVVYLQLSSL